MSRIWVTRVHGSAKVVVRIGLVQQRTMLTDPSYFFCVWFLVPLPLFLFFRDPFGTGKFGLQDENDYDDSNVLLRVLTSHTPSDAERSAAWRLFASERHGHGHGRRDMIYSNVMGWYMNST